MTIGDYANQATNFIYYTLIVIIVIGAVLAIVFALKKKWTLAIIFFFVFLVSFLIPVKRVGVQNTPNGQSQAQ